MKTGKKFEATGEDMPGKEDLSYAYCQEKTHAPVSEVLLPSLASRGALQKFQTKESYPSDVKTLTSGKKHVQEFYFHHLGKSCKPNTPYMDFLTANEKLAGTGLDLVEVRAPNTLSIICKKTSIFTVPSSTKQSKKCHMFDRMKSRRRSRTQSEIDLHKLVSQCALPLWPRSASGAVDRWILESVERKDEVRNLLRANIGSVFSHASSEKMRSLDAISTRKCIPNLLTGPSPWNPLLGESKYVSEKRMIASHLSASSSPSQLLSSCGHSRGVLHCAWKFGVPHFEFHVDGYDDVYLANLLTAESLYGATHEGMYIFRLRSHGQKKIESCRDTTSKVVGKMKVSSCFTVDASNLKQAESEFVLFGCSESHDHQAGEVGVVQNHSVLSNKIFNIFRSNTSSKHRCRAVYGKACFDQPSSALENHLPPNLELSAIHMKGPLLAQNHMGAEDGWGFKFLKGVAGAGSMLLNRKKPPVHVTVIVPAGYHGGPRTRNGGPSNLLERWRADGHCDCGGWDVGCPLTVFDNCPHDTPNFFPTDSEDCRSLNLFIKGAKGDHAFKVVNVHKGLYFVYFASNLSALVSFSIAVASIHAQSSTAFYRGLSMSLVQ